MAAGEKLAPDEVARLRAGPVRVSLSDLQTIGKITSPPERYDVVAALSEGRAKSASQALAQVRNPQPERSSHDVALARLQAVWDRAPKSARRAFLADNAEELRGLLGGGDEA